MTPALDHVCRKILRLEGVESADITDLGAIYVVLSGGLTTETRNLREDILDIGRRAMLPIQVFYRLPDGNVVGEESEDLAKQEWVDDFYKPLIIPGFLGTTSEAPPEKVSKEVDGALMLRRVRASTRGQPVVAWRYGDQEVRAGSKIRFDKGTALQWTMGRSLSIRPGAMGTVSQLSSRRPIAFIQVGDYQNVELPVHMLGHFFTVMPKTESIAEAKKKPDNGAGEFNHPDRTPDIEFAPEFNRLLNVVGFGKPADWGRDPDKDDVPVNEPFDRDNWIARSKDTIDDHKEYEEVVTFAEAKKDAEEDMLLPPGMRKLKRKLPPCK